MSIKRRGRRGFRKRLAFESCYWFCIGSLWVWFCLQWTLGSYRMFRQELCLCFHLALASKNKLHNVSILGSREFPILSFSGLTWDCPLFLKKAFSPNSWRDGLSLQMTLPLSLFLVLALSFWFLTLISNFLFSCLCQHAFL